MVGGRIMKPYRAALLATALIAAPALALGAPAPCSAPDFAKQAEAMVAPFTEAGVFSGTVLVAVDGKPVFRKAYGLANREWNVPNTPDAKFRIGSITKQFTATAILQLAEQGKLSIDDPVSKYYPSAPPAWSKITIRHLLTHTSGIPTYTALPGFFDRQARMPFKPEELVKLTQDKPLDFAPGTNYAYDNSGYVLLGVIVEKASGEPYAKYVQEHIFAPLGMKDTGYDSDRTIIAKRAAGYDVGPGGALNAAFLDMSVPFSAGSLYSTVDDLLIWDQALYAAKPLKAESLKAMFTDYGHKYGFGFQIDSKWDHPRIAHGGGINGFITEFERYPLDRLTVIVLSNIENPAPNTIAPRLAGLCLGAQVLPKQAGLPPAQLDAYVGDYEPAPGVIVHVAREGDHLAAVAPGGSPTLFYPSDETHFFARLEDRQIRFVRDDKGQVSAFVSVLGPVEQTARRVDAAEAARQQQALAKHVAEGKPAPGSEAALRRFIDQVVKGEPDYATLGPQLAQAVKQQMAGGQNPFTRFGALQDVTFTGVGPGGMDIYVATFANAKLEWRIILGDDGKILGLNFRPAA
jgi:CubicO group peptidase (beta-lactamase class C family)